MNKFLSANFLKFLVSGGTAALVEYGAFLILNNIFGVDILYANSISFGCGLLVSYILNRRWVFRSNAEKKKQFLSYSLLALLNLLLSNGMVWLLVHVCLIVPFIAKFITMGLIASWNYLIFSKIIFRK